MNMEVLMQYITYALIAKYHHAGDQRDAGTQEHPDKRCSTCDCADPVPVGCGDFVYLFAYSDSVVLHCRSGDCCLYCVSGRYGRMGKGIRDVEPNEI